MEIWHKGTFVKLKGYSPNKSSANAPRAFYARVEKHKEYFVGSCGPTEVLVGACFLFIIQKLILCSLLAGIETDLLGENIPDSHEGAR